MRNGCIANFNSIKVQLKRIQTSYICNHCINFNSIKVQLKLKYFAADGSVTLFQFHKGTIKTANKEAAAKIIKFQFHKGTIKTHTSCTPAKAEEISIP